MSVTESINAPKNTPELARPGTDSDSPDRSLRNRPFSAMPGTLLDEVVSATGGQNAGQRTMV